MSEGALGHETLRQLIEAGRSLLSHLELEPLLDRLLETARDLTGAKYAALGILDEDRRELERFVTSGIDPETHAVIGDLPRGRGVLGVLITEPEPLRLRNVGDHPRSYGFPPGHPDMNGFLGVPIIIRGEAWGNLYLTEKQSGEEFTKADEDAVVVLAAWAAIAIDNARLYEAAEKRRNELERAVVGLRTSTEIARAIGAETDLSKVLELIAKRGRALVEARALTILLSHGNGLRIEAAAGEMNIATARLEVPMDASVAGRVFRSGRSERLDDARDRLWIGAQELGTDPVSALMVPMTFRGSTVGVLAAYDRMIDGPAFTRDDEDLLRSFATSGATAVQTAQSVAEDRLRHSMEAAEQERRRWARELHDETLQGLAGLNVLLETAASQGSEGALRAAVDQTTAEIRQQIQALRALITELRPAALDELGLGAAIESLTERLRTVEGLEVELDLGGDGPLRRLPSETETAIYRFVQEALTNVAKHARADTAAVLFRESDGVLEVTVSDDGTGFDPDATTGGFGILGMRERLALANGELAIESEPGIGTSVRASLPVPTATGPAEASPTASG
jgi:signal transduction histidine kinase